MRRSVMGLAIASLFGTAAAQAQMQVVSTTPARQAVVAADTTVSVTFDEALNTSTITPSTLRVFGRISGTHSGTPSFSNADQTVTFTPDEPFAAGETVLVNLSHDIAAADATPLTQRGLCVFLRHPRAMGIPLLRRDRYALHARGSPQRDRHLRDDGGRPEPRRRR